MPPSPFNPRSAAATPLRVLVTGGAGFIGATLAREFIARGAAVVCADDLSSGSVARLPVHSRLRFEHADMGEPGALAGLLATEEPFDALVHLAARVGVRAVLRDPEGCRHANRRGVRGCLRAIEALSPGDRPRLFYASSSEVYQESQAPLAEGDAERPVDGVGRWAYAGSKLAGEREIDAAAALWSAGRGPVHLRFFNVVGPGQDADSGMVLATFVERALAGEPIPVHGMGRAVRTFAHVEQVARALADLIEHPALPPGVLNVGGAARASVLELARTVERLSGSRAGLVFVDPREHCGAGFEAVRWRQPALERLRALGVQVPELSLEEIVSDTLARHVQLAPGPVRVDDPQPGPAQRDVCASPSS